MKISVTNIYVDDQGKAPELLYGGTGLCQEDARRRVHHAADVAGSTITMLKATCGNLIQLTQLARY
jgi:hypothetical protein